ncbi:Ribosomal RNA large subunit methyltransferase I [Andreprevotia sp. IGB-42]|uniref:class I SAM-dependent rRNA methyltransferase n=1 Tax=Andreprevotia sp. IGB-42 TaxID=2497473 RepID=UPI001357B1DD|nr:class I SAM-dependent methyltransferase [Andreprevotia sp. IGB-42]KAF0814915.1 Ribosomal RNA large subunit methyltransferase I [Andreprevotia sp. IGB-42]
MSTTLTDLLNAALANRSDLLAKLHGEKTNAYRLFHGSAEGEAGLTVDRYGDLLLVQSFHESLTPEELAEIEAFYARDFAGLDVVYNDRSQSNSRISNRLTPEQIVIAETPRIAQELGVDYRIQARHDGQDPWLFLDLRAGRRRVMQEAKGKTVLNLFAYTCGVGIAAAKAGASLVTNVDFAESSLLVGKENSRLNSLGHTLRYVESDAFAALRQYSGLGQARVVRGKRLPPFPKLEKTQFDLVFLDPPRYSKSIFGVVDLVNDYPAVFKPALLSTREGGTLICCNNVASVDRQDWYDQLQRSATKAGRPIREMEWISPEADFPSTDGKPPLKIALLRV